MFRCTSLRNKHSSCQQMSATNERLILPLEQSPADNTKPESEHQLFNSFLKLIQNSFVYMKHIN